MTYMYMATPWHMNPCPGYHESYNFGRSFHGHQYFILNLSDLCMGVEKKIFEEIMHFHYMTYMATPQHKNPCPEGHEFYNLGRPFPGHHYYILSLVCLKYASEQKSRFLRNTSILQFLPKNYLPFGTGGGGGVGCHDIYNFLSCLLTLQMLHTKFG